tara:strand:- start:1598 stop:1828 length:231 start_codon:yes stop_codon:yes gene_type:complete
MKNTKQTETQEIESSFQNGFTLKEMLATQEQDRRTGMDKYMPKSWYRLENRFFYRNPFGAWPKKISQNWEGEYLGQ